MKCEKHGEQATFCRFCDQDTIDEDWLKRRLTDNKEISIYSVVQMALRDLSKREYDSALDRLAVDLDKLRMHDVELVEFVMKRRGQRCGGTS